MDKREIYLSRQSWRIVYVFWNILKIYINRFPFGVPNKSDRFLKLITQIEGDQIKQYAYVLSFI